MPAVGENSPAAEDAGDEEGEEDAGPAAKADDGLQEEEERRSMRERQLLTLFWLPLAIYSLASLVACLLPSLFPFCCLARCLPPSLAPGARDPQLIALSLSE